MHEPHEQLSHEKLDVYRCGIAFLALTLRLLSSLRRGDGEIRDQLKRAAMSIVLNVAEGAGDSEATEGSRA